MIFCSSSQIDRRVVHIGQSQLEVVLDLLLTARGRQVALYDSAAQAQIGQDRLAVMAERATGPRQDRPCFCARAAEARSSGPFTLQPVVNATLPEFIRSILIFLVSNSVGTCCMVS